MAVSKQSSGPILEALKRGLPRLIGLCAVFFVLGAGIAMLSAQVAGNRGIPPVASSTDVQVSDIEVDIQAETGEAARQIAWRRAQRLAWDKLDGPALSNSQIEALVSAIVIQRERVGPKRYVATLGVIFDRRRAARYLGGATRQRGSAPMLLMPVTSSAGTYTVFEVRNPWQRAWAEFNPGSSRINYVRPNGAGGDSLLLTYGQTGRRSRAWWRVVLDQFTAADVLIPIAELRHQYPGGPITGTFTARYGPDSRFLDQFQLEANGPDDLPDMLDKAVRQIDALYEEALAQGKLSPDPTLEQSISGDVDPAFQRLIEIGRAMRARQEAALLRAEEQAVVPGGSTVSVTNGSDAASSSFVVQFATPDAGVFDDTVQSVRGTSGVRGIAVSSTAMGGTSVMNVSYGGSLDELAEALRARGFTVRQGANALAISR